jgi:hypothetical protein
MMVNGVDTIVPYGTAGSTNYAYYQLVNASSSAIPATGSDSGIAIGVVPANSVAPVNATTSPLQVVSGSFGFDPTNVQVFLSPSDPAPQILGLVFAGSGLSAGGTLDFKVSLDPSYTSMTAPPLSTILPPGAASSTVLPTLSSYTPLVADGAPPAVANTPEPVSLALWSALAAVGIVRVRAFRKAGRTASNVV